MCGLKSIGDALFFACLSLFSSTRIGYFEACLGGSEFKLVYLPALYSPVPCCFVHFKVLRVSSILPF